MSFVAARSHALALVIVGLVADGALAHELLDAPQRRYDDMKGGPCGRGRGEDGRTSRFTRYQPGETITVRWTEVIDHVSRWVIAFDDDGADQADFDANILHTEPDPQNPSGKGWSAEVTLPDVTCTNCTLQLLQIMTTRDDPSPSDIYDQCADLVLGDGESAGAEVFGGCQSTSASPWTLPLLGLARRWRRRREAVRGRAGAPA
jgi:MYXO-CTERM domain-containing protein